MANEQPPPSPRSVIDLMPTFCPNLSQPLVRCDCPRCLLLGWNDVDNSVGTDGDVNQETFIICPNSNRRINDCPCLRCVTLGWTPIEIRIQTPSPLASPLGSPNSSTGTTAPPPSPSEPERNDVDRTNTSTE